MYPGGEVARVGRYDTICSESLATAATAWPRTSALGIRVHRFLSFRHCFDPPAALAYDDRQVEPGS